MLRINILTRYDFPLFSQQIDDQRTAGRIELTENGGDDREWDLVLVFDGLAAPQSFSVRAGGLVFVAGEPPDGIAYTREFLSQFDMTYCAHPYARDRANNRPDQYFNNWHFGYNPSTRHFRWSFRDLACMPIPSKTRDVSVIMSNLAYMPNHLKRRHFLALLQERLGDRLDVFGRGHRFIPYKDEALLPYRYHICIENSVVPDLWTEKLADPFLGWSVPIYGGCPNVERYFPANALVRIDLDDVDGAVAVIGRLLEEGQAGYLRRLSALIEARQLILVTHNITTFAARAAEQVARAPILRQTLRQNEQTFGHGVENALLRIRRYAYRRYFLIARGIDLI